MHINKKIIFIIFVILLLPVSACKGSDAIFYLGGKAIEDFYIVKAEKPTGGENTAAFKIRMAVEEGFSKDMAYYFLSDSKEDIVHTYEIIVGNTTRLLEEEYPISKLEMGDTGYFIQAIKNKIYINAGSDDALNEAADFFIQEFITEKEKIEIPADYELIQEAVFDIQDIYIQNQSIREYKIIYDDENAGKEAYDRMNEVLIDKAGIFLEGIFKEDALSEDKAIILSNKPLPGEGFIRFAVEGNNLLISCTAEEGILYGVNLFLETYIENGSGSFNFPERYVYSDIDDMIQLMPE